MRKVTDKRINIQKDRHAKKDGQEAKRRDRQKKTEADREIDRDEWTVGHVEYIVEMTAMVKWMTRRGIHLKPLTTSTDNDILRRSLAAVFVKEQWKRPRSTADATGTGRCRRRQPKAN